MEEIRSYTYEVKMIVHMLDTNEEQAKIKLDQQGGHVSSREVTLLDTSVVYDPDKV